MVVRTYHGPVEGIKGNHGALVEGLAAQELGEVALAVVEEAVQPVVERLAHVLKRLDQGRLLGRPLAHGDAVVGGLHGAVLTPHRRRRGSPHGVVRFEARGQLEHPEVRLLIGEVGM